MAMLPVGKWMVRKNTPPWYGLSGGPMMVACNVEVMVRRLLMHVACCHISPASETDPPRQVRLSTGRAGHVQGPAALCWCALKPLWFWNASEILDGCLVSVWCFKAKKYEAQSSTKSREIQPSNLKAEHYAIHISQYSNKKLKLFFKFWPFFFSSSFYFIPNSHRLLQFSSNSVTLCNSTAALLQRSEVGFNIQPVPRTRPAWLGTG